MVELIKWCHLADIHLGYKQYNLNDRYEDFIDAFNNCIELIIEKEPDFVLLPGDLFEHYNPKPGTIRKCIVILKKLKEQNIPIYVIRGNHDVSTSKLKRYGGNILELLQDLSLITYIDDSVVIMKKDGQEIAIIAGMGYYGKQSSKKLEQFLKNNDKLLNRNDIPKILMLHAFIDDMIKEGGEDLHTYNLNLLDFNYIALGHYHLQWPSNYKDPKNKIFCSGATEHRNALEWRQPERGFYYVECIKDNDSYKILPEYISFKVRPKKRIILTLENVSADTVVKKISETIKENDVKDSLLHIFVKASLKSGEISLININELKNLAKNVLRIDISTDFTDTSVIITEQVEIRDTIAEILKKEFNVPDQDISQMVSLIENILKNAQDKDFSEEVIELIKSSEPDININLLNQDILTKNSTPKKKTKKSIKLDKNKIDIDNSLNDNNSLNEISKSDKTDIDEKNYNDNKNVDNLDQKTSRRRKKKKNSEDGLGRFL
ncbi:MAG: metallophosphoesterase family protein [Candidatus Helarchaeota archaeon]